MFILYLYVCIYPPAPLFLTPKQICLTWAGIRSWIWPTLAQHPTVGFSRCGSIGSLNSSQHSEYQRGRILSYLSYYWWNITVHYCVHFSVLCYSIGLQMERHGTISQIWINWLISCGRMVLSQVEALKMILLLHIKMWMISNIIPSIISNIHKYK